MDQGYTRIAGTAAVLGSERTSVDELARRFKPDDTDRARYIRKYGFGELQLAHFKDQQEFEQAAVTAAQEAIHKGGIDPYTVGHVYSALACPTERRFLPGFARDLAEWSGLENASTVDIGRGCVASIQAMQAAHDRLQQKTRDGEQYAAVIIAGENASTVIDPRDQSTSLIFSSGIGAVVLSNYGPASHRLVRAEYRNFGRNDLTNAGKSADEMRAMIDSMVILNPLLTERREFFHMDGDRVYEFAVRHALPIGLDLLGMNSMPHGAYLIPHQPSPKAVQSLISLNGLAPENVHTEGALKIGNTSSATTLIALDTELRKPEIREREIILLAFGSGPTVGAAYLRPTKYIR